MHGRQQRVNKEASQVRSELGYVFSCIIIRKNMKSKGEKPPNIPSQNNFIVLL